MTSLNGQKTRASGASKKAPARTAGWRGVHDALRTDILSLALAPGELLDETRLSRRFGFSRSPVLRALIRCAGAWRVDASV